MLTDVPIPRPGSAELFEAVTIARRLGPGLAKRAAAHDRDDSFVADSFAEFREHKLFSAGVPAELGGGGATHPELCAMLQEIARCCGSSALAFSMHTHLLATTVWRWKHGATAVEPLLRRIAAEQLILVSRGGSDWVEGSGRDVKIDGGYLVSGRKVFASGSPSGQLLMTTAVYDDPVAGATVLHVPIPLNSSGVWVHDNWRTMGMRATGSNDVTLEGLFVADGAVSLRRPKGEWHQFFDVLSPLVWPLVMSVYVGVAESARHLHKTIAARSALCAVDRAMEICGGASFFRSAGIERIFRDVQGVRFHPWQERKQYVFSGRVALGLDPL